MLQTMNVPTISRVLQIHVLGSFSVRQDPDMLDLPRSRKTRALLAYLAVTRRRHRRDRLCEMFWDLPDDPRAALRWSLSKLREVVGEVLQADRDSVGLRPGTFDLDIDMLPAASTLATLPIAALERAVELCSASFLDDLRLPRVPLYEAWHRAHASEIDLLHLRARRALTDRLRDTAPERALAHLQALSAAHPTDAALAKEVDLLTARCRREAARPSTPLPLAASWPDVVSIAPSLSVEAVAARQQVS